LAPSHKDENLQQLIKQLRDNGERVINDLSDGDNSAQQQMCNRQIIHDGNQWVVKEVK